MKSPNFDYGILGGGQLSMMLAQQAQRLGIKPRILTPHDFDPATSVCPNISLGNPKNAKDLKNFAHALNVLTFESEFYTAAELKKNLKDSKVYVYPSLANLELLQDRKTQKQLFVDSKLLTSPHICSADEKEVGKFFLKHGALVAKKRLNGYDGYGTFLIDTQKELDSFLNEHASDLNELIFEKRIDFHYEVAVQVARSRKGHTVFFPFVKTIQREKKCFLVEGPEKPNAKLQKQIEKFLKKIDYVGVIGFEFFKTKKGLILNEVAPRVHNTGHHTLDSCDVDQFTMHILCGTQDKLPQPDLKAKAFVMLNLIGESEAPVTIPNRADGQLYWYGKTNRAGRKLGHVTFTGENKKALMKRAFAELKRWKL